MQENGVPEPEEYSMHLLRLLDVLTIKVPAPFRCLAEHAPSFAQFPRCAARSDVCAILHIAEVAISDALTCSRVARSPGVLPPYTTVVACRCADPPCVGSLNRNQCGVSMRTNVCA